VNFKFQNSTHDGARIRQHRIPREDIRNGFFLVVNNENIFFKKTTLKKVRLDSEERPDTSIEKSFSNNRNDKSSNRRCRFN
jgi:hypothetical protein